MDAPVLAVQHCTDTECNLEDPPEAMEDRNVWQERERERERERPLLYQLDLMMLI